jgi:hypothetical protein
MRFIGSPITHKQFEIILRSIYKLCFAWVQASPSNAKAMQKAKNFVRYILPLGVVIICLP